MRSRLGRTPAAVLLLPLLVATTCGSSGCQLNRSFFQMDSNSRVPFFGVDLTPNWPERASAVDGVSRLQSETARVAKTEPDDTVDKPQKQQRLTLPVADVSHSAAPADTAPIEQFR